MGEAGALHDRFNLVFIPPLVTLTALSLLRPTETLHLVLSWSVMAYILMDIVYHFVVPHCQPGPVRLVTTLIHHFIVVWLVLHPLSEPRHLHFTAWATIVEVNTLCQVLNKAFKMKIFSIGFLVTWFSLRLLWYPYLAYWFHNVLTGEGLQVFGYTYCQVVGSQVALCALGLFWSVEFVMGRAKPKDAKDKAA